MIRSEIELGDNPITGVEITSGMQSFWQKIWRWAVFLGLGGGLGSLLILLYLSKYVFRILKHSDAGYIRHAFLDPMFISIISSLVVSLIANYYQLRFAYQLKSAINSENQASFELAWFYFRNFVVLFAVFILICTAVLLYGAVNIIIGF